MAGGPAGGALRVSRLLEEAKKKSRMYLSGGRGPCEPFETRWPFQVSCSINLVFAGIFSDCRTV